MTDPIQEPQLHRLIYASIPHPELKLSGLKSILKDSTNNNSRDNVTGALFFSEDYFLQILEGSREQLTLTFSRIIRDERHSHVCLIEFGPCPERKFERYAMRHLALDEKLLLEALDHHQFDPLRWTANECNTFLTKYTTLLSER